MRFLIRRGAALGVRLGLFALGLVTFAAASASAAAASTIYVMNNNNTISSFDTAAKTLTTVATIAPPATATVQNLAETPDGLLYFIDANGELWRFNPATSVTTDVGSTGLGTSPARLAGDSLGRLVTVDDTSTTISYISATNATTLGTAALTGGTSTGGGDLAIAPNGTIFEVSGTAVYTFAETGGPVTTLTANDGATSNVTSLAFDPVSGVLYGGNTGGPPTSVYTINQTTGAGTLFAAVATGGTFNDYASLPTFPNLSITKTHTGNFPIGTTGTYTIAVKNVGTFPTSGTITVTDTLPAGLTYNAAGTSGTGWTCSEPAAPNVVCTSTTAIAAGATSNPITLAVNVVGPAATVTNTATVSGGGVPPILTEAPANDPTVIVPNAKLTVAKTGTAAANQNGTVSYTVVVSNAGPSAANGTTVSDPVPASITGVTTTCGAVTGGAVCPPSVAAGNTIATTVPTLPSGGSVTFTVTGIASTPGSITNTATIAPPSGTSAATGSTLTSSQATAIAPVAKLTVAKTGTASINQNGTVTYSVVVSNAGPSAANGTTLSDPVPANITGVTTTCGAVTGGAVCPGSVAAGNSIATTVPTLPSGASVTFTVTGTATTPGSVTNTATIAPPAGTNADPASTLTSSQATTVSAAAKLTVTKTGPATVNQGGTISYTIVVGNAGPAAANGTTVNDPVPANITNVTTTCGSATGGAACPASVAPGNTIATTVPTLPSGGSVTFTVTGAATTSGGITNSATIAPPAGTNAAAGSTLTSSAATTITPVANLSITKTGPAQAAVNGLIAYTVVVSNAGPSGANGAVIADTLPAGINFSGTPTCTASGGAACPTAQTGSGNALSATIPTFPSGSSITFTFNATTATAGTYTNTASIAPPAGTVSTLPASSSVTTVVSASGGFSKTVRNVTTGGAASTANTGRPGDVLEYALTFTNTTGATISNFAVSDATPANTTYVSSSCGTLSSGVTGCTITNPAVGGTGTVTFTYAGSLANGSVASFLLDVKIR